MYMDKENLFSDAQGVSSTSKSANAINLGKGGFGSSTPPYFMLAAAGFAGTGSISVEVEVADDEAFTQNKEIIAIFPLKTELLEQGGQVLACGLPVNNAQYVRLGYTVTGSVGALKLTAGLTYHS